MKFLTVTALTLVTSAAFAKSNTEYFYLPSAAQSALTVDYSTKAHTDDDGTSSPKTTTSDIGLDYQYGLSEGNVIGAHTFSGSSKSDAANSTTKNGLGDIFIDYKGAMNLWHYGAELGINMGNMKDDNRSSGGMTLNANFGGLWSSNAWNYGFNIGLGYPFDRKAETGTPTTNLKETGGTSAMIAAFGEYNYGMGFIVGELAEHMIQDTTISTDPATTDLKVKAFNYTSLKLEGTYDFNDMITGLLSYEADLLPSHDVTGASTTSYKSTTDSIAMLGVRFVF